MKENLELEKIREVCVKCVKCDLSIGRTNVVFGKGNPHAPILFIGEAPGEKEDLQGLPFVGRAGKNLDKLLNVIGLTIEDVYIANILKCRPPKNRDPNLDEIKTCTPYLIEQIKAIKPKVIATLGNYSTKFVLSGFKPEEMKKVAGIAELHGKVKKVNFNDFSFTVVPIYHPAAMLYRPALKEDFEHDFKVMQKIISEDGFEFKPKEKNKNLSEF